ncbi:MAG: ZIP family metal transporter [Henriciella sp.]|uniref:ZIP family metal transporter n=1 Tax=Henriciella sp. TaxID=1968823 RepID=UPI003C739E67
MTEFMRVLAFAALPALGNIGGVLLAETMRPPRWVNGALLHGAAGIAIAIVSVELMPRAMDSAAMWAIGLAFIAGAIASLGIAKAVNGFSERAGGTTSAWMVYAAIMADLVSDGLITGAGSAASLELGVFLAGSQLVANLPGGFAASSNLRKQDVSRRMRLIAGVVITLPTFLSAAIGYLLLRSAPAEVQAICLAAIAGLLVAATLEDLIPEGNVPRPPRWSTTLALAIGFAAITALSGLIGGP